MLSCRYFVTWFRGMWLKVAFLTGSVVGGNGFTFGFNTDYPKATNETDRRISVCRLFRFGYGITLIIFTWLSADDPCKSEMVCFILSNWCETETFFGHGR